MNNKASYCTFRVGDTGLEPVTSTMSTCQPSESHYAAKTDTSFISRLDKRRRVYFTVQYYTPVIINMQEEVAICRLKFCWLCCIVCSRIVDKNFYESINYFGTNKNFHLTIVKLG